MSDVTISTDTAVAAVNALRGLAAVDEEHAAAYEELLAVVPEEYRPVEEVEPELGPEYGKQDGANVTYDVELEVHGSTDAD